MPIQLTQLLYQINQKLHDALNRIMHHPLFQSLERDWLQLLPLLQQSITQYILPLSDTLEDAINDLLKSEILDNNFLYPGEHLFSILIYDLPNKNLLSKIAPLANQAFIPVLHTNKKTINNLFLYYATPALQLRTAYSIESIDTLEDINWANPCFSIVMHWLNQSCHYQPQFQSLKQSLGNNRHHPIIQQKKDQPSLWAMELFCQIAHALKQLLRNKIGFFF
jgi:hypothetical protein